MNKLKYEQVSLFFHMIKIKEILNAANKILIKILFASTLEIRKRGTENRYIL